jgi:putative DNA primase/helicase
LARQGDATASALSEQAESEPGRRSARRSGRRADAADELIVGRLIDHGEATYQHKPGSPRSYFVQLETQRGERTLWGVDLERAIRTALSQPQIGDEVGLRRARREPVTVKATERDAHGNVIAERDKLAQRTQWILEKQAFLEQRADAAATFGNPQVTAQTGIRQHPELLGSYLQLRSAEEVAVLRIRDPQDQREFVARIRGAIAESIASGAPLPPVRLRESKEATREKGGRVPPTTDRVAALARG